MGLAVGRYLFSNQQVASLAGASAYSAVCRLVSDTSQHTPPAAAQLEEELHALRQRCSATERLQGESMHQLTVARRLLEDATMADDRAKLATAQQELRSSRASVVAQRRESLLLKDRLAATEGQLQFMERQLHVAVHAPLAAAAAAAAGGGRSGAAQPALVDQLRRLLETKEERIRWGLECGGGGRSSS